MSEIKNEINNLSENCKTSNIINTRVFITSNEKEYLYDRIKIEDNTFEFHFQGKDFNIECSDKETKLNLVLNEFSTNIYYNQTNIFNFMTPNLITNNRSHQYKIVIRNNILNMYRDKIQPILKCNLPEIFNIEKIGLRSYNKNCWWISNI